MYWKRVDGRRKLGFINSDGKATLPLDPPDDVTVAVHDLRLRLLARTPYEHLLVELSTTATAETAIATGVDGIFIDTFADYGIDRIRAITGAPVIGAGEASIRHAARTHDRYSVVTVWPTSMAYIYADRLRHEGGEACAGVHHLADEDELDRVGTDAGVKARMGRGEDEVVDQLAQLCRRALDGDRSEAVLLGCTCMSPVADRLTELVGAPVLDPSRIGLAAAFEAIDQPRGHLHTMGPTSGLASTMVDAYLGLRGETSVVLDDCDVCAVAST